MNEFYRDLWLKAQANAKREYEEEYDKDSWDEADKYEREDYVFAEYDRLRKERENMAQRDPKTGRFVSTKNNNETINNTTTNTTNNVKENDDMMNKTMTKAEERTMKLAQSGYNTDNLFNLTLSVPFGKEVRILVDGKEVTVPTTTLETTATAYGNHVVSGLARNFGVPTFVASNGDVCDAETGEVLVKVNDPIAQSIINDGYVKNSKLFRRYVLAHTMKLLEYVDRKNPNRKGWEAGFKDMYGYGYCFEMLKEELHTLAKLQKEDPEYFAERTRFFNGDVVVATLNDYLYRLKKYCNKQMRENPKKYKGQAYVKLARYGNVLVKDLDTKVYEPIKMGIEFVKSAAEANDYSRMERKFNEFMSKYYNKLPYETPKCAVFKDAYKGAGAYFSLQNMIRFHGVDVVGGCRGKYYCEEYLSKLLNGEYKNEVWRFHQLLVETIENNNFDLRRSIAEGHNAPGTVSEKADRYRR